MYSRSAKGGEKGDPSRNPWLAKMGTVKRKKNKIKPQHNMCGTPLYTNNVKLW